MAVWKRAVYIGLPVAVLVLFVATGIRLAWFVNPEGGAWTWIEASSWVVGIGMGIASLIILVVDRRKAARAQEATTRPPRDPSLLDRDAEFDFLHGRLSKEQGGVVTVVGEAGIGKSKLVDTVVASLKQEMPHLPVHLYTLGPDIHLDVRQLIANIEGVKPPVVLKQGEPLLGRLAIALEKAEQERVIIVVEAAQHLLVKGDKPHLDLQLDEAFEAIATDRRHHVTVVLVSNKPLTSKASNRRWSSQPSIHLRDLPEDDMDTLLARDSWAKNLPKLTRSTLCHLLKGNPRCVQLMRATIKLSARRMTAEQLIELVKNTNSADLLSRLQAVALTKLRTEHRKVIYALAAYATPIDSTAVVNLLAGDVREMKILGALKDLVDNQFVCATHDEQYYLPTDDFEAFLPPETSDERSTLLRGAADELAKRRVTTPTEPDHLRMHFAQLRALLTAGRHAVAYDVIEDITTFLNKWNCGFMLLDQREKVRNHLGDQFTEMANDNELGYLYGEKQKTTEASEAYGRALAYANQRDDPKLHTEIRTNLASMYWQKGDTQWAYNYYEEARKEARSQGEPEALMVALLGLANCHRRWGQYDKAISRAKEILAIAAPSDAARIVRVSLLLARWHTECEDLPEAKIRLATAQQLANDDPRLRVSCLDGKADLFLAQGQIGEAHTWATDAVEQAVVIRDPVAILQARTTLCMADLIKGDMDKAARHIEDAMRYREEGRALVVLALHALVTQKTHPEDARPPFDELATQAQSRIDMDGQDFGAYDMLGFAICGQLLNTDDELDDATEAFDKAREITKGAEPGLVKRRLLLVRQLDDSAPTSDRLAPVIQILSGIRTRPPE